MSKQLITDAKLHGYSGPIDISTEQFQDRLPLKWLSNLLNEKASKMISGHLEQFQPTTSDTYGWFSGSIFKTMNGTVAVLIPWAQDHEKKDGSAFDRAVALYTKGTVTEAEIAELLLQLGDNIERVATERQKEIAANEAGS